MIYKNEKLNVEMNCYINAKNEIWFRGKEIALILDYKDTKRAIQKHVHDNDKKLIDFKLQTHVNSSNSRGGQKIPS